MSTSPDSVLLERLSFKKHLLLTLILIAFVLLGWKYFSKSASAHRSDTVPGADTAFQRFRLVATGPAFTAASATQSAQAPESAPGQGKAEINSEIDSDLYHIVFTNRGALAKSWVLKKYKDDTGKPLQLINAGSGLPLPFALDFTGRKPGFDANSALYQTQVSNGGDTVDFTYSDGTTAIHKTFEFRKDSYLSAVTSSVVDGNGNLPHLLTWRGGFGDSKPFKAFVEHTPVSTIESIMVNGMAGGAPRLSKIRTVYYNPAGAGFLWWDRSLITFAANKARNGPVSETGNFTFGGIEDGFFAAVVLPPDNTPLEVRTYSDDIRPPGESDFEQYAGAGVGMAKQNSFLLFVGPKDLEALQSASPKLRSIVDAHYSSTVLLATIAAAFLVAALRARAASPQNVMPLGLRKRHGGVTSLLVFWSATNTVSLVILVLKLKWGDYQDLADVMTALAQVIFFVALLNWKKWGYFGLVAVAVFSSAARYFMSPLAALEYGLIPGLLAANALSLAFVYFLLQIGGERRTWAQLN